MCELFRPLGLSTVVEHFNDCRAVGSVFIAACHLASLSPFNSSDAVDSALS